MAESVKYRAVYKFKGTNNDELKFKKGDVITITQKEDGGWWEGTLDGRTGWFPSNYVEEIPPDQNGGQPADKEIPEEVLAKNIDYRQQVIRDLLEKEQEFVSDLRSLLNQYLQPLSHADILEDTEYNQLVGNLEDLIEAHQRLNSSLEDVRRGQPRQQRVGQVFLQFGNNIRTAHLGYWANHPKAVCILEKYRDKLNTWLDTCQGGTGSSPPGLMILTTGLSRPFRQLERLAGAIQEVAQHLEDDHVDRGDTQRSIAFYKEVASEAARARRQKELELEVLTGTVRGWEGESIDQLGDIIKMAPVVIGQGANKKDRYLVLFPNTLLLLSASSRLSAFLYEGKLPLSGLTVTKHEDMEATKNFAFEISGSMIETIQCHLNTKSEYLDWVEKLQNQIRMCRQSAVLPTKLAVHPVPPPHKSTAASITGSPGGAAVRSAGRVGLASRGGGVQGWKMNCLRPAPPTRSFFQADKRNTLRRKEVEQSSYEDDLQILRVIEAYCTTKQRQTITNSAMFDSVPLLSLADDSPLDGDLSCLSDRSQLSHTTSSSCSISGGAAGHHQQQLQSAGRNSINKLDRLEREVMGLTTRLEQEAAARRKLQELLLQAGISLPAEALPQ